jgi:hypothetical protein
VPAWAWLFLTFLFVMASSGAVAMAWLARELRRQRRGPRVSRLAETDAALEELERRMRDV